MHSLDDVTKSPLYKPRFMKLLLLFKLIVFALVITFVTPSLAQNSEADVEKKWEFGIGAGSLVGPDYRGSDEYRDYSAPIP